MTVQTRQRPRRTRSLRPLHLGRGATRSPAVAPEDLRAPTPSDARERDAGGPEDRALYHCHCGYVFQASVSTTVGCPNCGGAQAW